MFRVDFLSCQWEQQSEVDLTKSIALLEIDFYTWVELKTRTQKWFVVIEKEKEIERLRASNYIY